MKLKAVSGIMLTLLLIGMLTLAFNIQPVKAEPKTWTVDDDGTADFHTIQEAINAAYPGDTICVYNGTYYENVVVNKTVSLIGEGPRLTLIFGDETGTVVYVKANNSIISGFGMQSCNTGIYVDNSSGNEISYNMLGNNYFGIHFHYSNNNVIHHNNFFTNTVQAYLNNSLSNMWDDGYPSGGNYWDDPVIIEWIPEVFGGGKRWSGPGGVDLYSGPYQNETGGDGISDVSYTIDADNEDRYPLMGLVNLFIDGWMEVPGWININSNSTVTDSYFNPDEGAFVSFNVTGQEGTSGYCRATISKQLLWAENNNWTVLIDDEPVDPKITEDANDTYLYFTYNHSTRNIQIIGTHAIPEFPSAIILPLFMILSLITVALVKHKKKKQ